METVTDFVFLGSKITADSDCSYEIRRHLLLGSKAMTNLDSVLKSGDIILLMKVRMVKVMANLDSILKSRDITSPTKVCLVKVMVLPVVMYGCESWTIKEAEH